MKKKIHHIIAVLAGIPFVYVATYFIMVAPYDTNERYMDISGWGPTYYCFIGPCINSNSPWPNYLRTFFNPIHQIDRVVRKDLWLTEEEKESIIIRASQPVTPTPFTYDMAVVRILNKPWQNKTHKKANYLHLFSPLDGFGYHSFTNCTTDNWKENYREISKTLISKSEQLNLDTESLQRALDLILTHSENRIAYLPTSVHQAVFNGRLSWIIRVIWEYPSEDQTWPLGHVRHFIFDQENLEMLDFKTCM